MPDDAAPQSSIILYQTEDGQTRIQCRFEDNTLWLTQKLIADLFQIGVNTVNHHLKEIYGEGELLPEATIRSYRIVQAEGSRQVARDIEHYSLPAILAVGYRVRWRDRGNSIAGCACGAKVRWNNNEKQQRKGWGVAVPALKGGAKFIRPLRGGQPRCVLRYDVRDSHAGGEEPGQY